MGLQVDDGRIYHMANDDTTDDRFPSLTFLQYFSNVLLLKYVFPTYSEQLAATLVKLRNEIDNG